MPKKFFKKGEVIGRFCIEEVRVDLEHLCSCSQKQCRIFHGSFSVNNFPLVYIHCIIKINVPSFGFRMIRLFVCDVQNKNRNFGCSA